MRQVPHYVIIGNGRVASHIQYYFSLLSLSFSHWHRNESISALLLKLNTASHILLLIKDDAIENFIQQHLNHSHALTIHFSGSLVSPLAYGAHPLMSFTDNLYQLKQYQSIPFLIDHSAPDFDLLLPGLNNPHHKLHTSLKPKYHALCVLSGNFSCLLWQKLFDTLEQEFNLPHSIAYPYLQQQTQNLILDYKSALTGPLIRQDKNTLKSNLEALEGDAFQKIYLSFIDAYLKQEEIL